MMTDITSLPVYAAFVISLQDNFIAATTRPYDKKVPIGLPGGKVDPGETPIEAVNRECREEGWDIVIDANEIPFNDVLVEGNRCQWFLSFSKREMLDDYLEKSEGITPVLVLLAEAINFGYGNDCLARLL